MLTNYLSGIYFTFIRVMRIAMVAVLICTSIKFLLKRKIEFNLLDIIYKFVWFTIVFFILTETGILYADFSTTSIHNRNVYFSFEIFEDGLSVATILNIILFIPFGFFSSIVFQKLREKIIYVVLIGFAFSCTIEFLQSFIGRFVQLEDIIMNTIGTFIGCILFIYLLKLIDIYYKVTSSSN